MRIISMFLVLLLPAFQALAGGNIAGKVTDEKGEAIIGATLLVKNTTLGTVTDVDGNFNIATAAGTFTLEVKYIGYQTKEVEEVAVTEGTVTRVNISISAAKTTELNEVVVHSSLKK